MNERFFVEMMMIQLSQIVVIVATSRMNATCIEKISNILVAGNLFLVELNRMLMSTTDWAKWVNSKLKFYSSIDLIVIENRLKFESEQMNSLIQRERERGLTWRGFFDWKRSKVSFYEWEYLTIRIWSC